MARHQFDGRLPTSGGSCRSRSATSRRSRGRPSLDDLLPCTSAHLWIEIQEPVPITPGHLLDWSDVFGQPPVAPPSVDIGCQRTTIHGECASAAARKTRRSSVHAQDHLRYRLHAGGTAARKERTVSEFTTRRLVPPASATMEGTRAKRSRWWSVAAVADSTAGFDVGVVRQARCRPGEFHGGCRRSGTAVEATALLLRVRAP